MKLKGIFKTRQVFINGKEIKHMGGEKMKNFNIVNCANGKKMLEIGVQSEKIRQFADALGQSTLYRADYAESFPTRSGGWAIFPTDDELNRVLHNLLPLLSEAEDFCLQQEAAEAAWQEKLNQQIATREKTKIYKTVSRRTRFGWNFCHFNTANETPAKPAFIGTAKTVLIDKETDRVYQSMRQNAYCFCWVKIDNHWQRVDWCVLDTLQDEATVEIGLAAGEKIWE